MLYRRQKRPGGIPAAKRPLGRKQPKGPGFHRIEFDMMIKGSFYKRTRGEVRQIGVTVDGSTRLVTSGDIVDEATYQALLAMEAIVPGPGDEPEEIPGEDAPELPPEPSPEGAD